MYIFDKDKMKDVKKLEATESSEISDVTLEEKDGAVEKVEDLAAKSKPEANKTAPVVPITTVKETWKDEIYKGKTSTPVDKMTVLFTPEAYLKMFAVVQDHTKEVAWEGSVQRLGEDRFLIKDIYVYPQNVTAATVDNEKKLIEELSNDTFWKDDLSDEVYNSLRFQGHSHVNMGVKPSSTDMNHQKIIAESLGDNDFYIFLIVNKKLDTNFFIYDKETATTYEDNDVNYEILFENSGDGENTLADFVNKARERVA